MPRLQVRSPGQGTHKNQPGGTTNWCFSFSLLPSLKSTYVNDPISKQTQAQAHSEVLGVRTSICEFPGDTVQPITLPSETRHIPQRETSPAFSRKPPRPEQWGGHPSVTASETIRKRPHRPAGHEEDVAGHCRPGGRAVGQDACPGTSVLIALPTPLPSRHAVSILQRCVRPAMLVEHLL